MREIVVPVAEPVGELGRRLDLQTGQGELRRLVHRSIEVAVTLLAETPHSVTQEVRGLTGRQYREHVCGCLGPFGFRE